MKTKVTQCVCIYVLRSKLILEVDMKTLTEKDEAHCVLIFLKCLTFIFF